MAGTVMHLVIADRLLEQFHIQNPGYFYCGNLAPDAVMNRKNYEREMKRHTHFKDGIRLHELRIPENFEAYVKRLNAFYDRLVAKPSDHWEIYFGYLTHMLVDELYLLHFRDGFVDQLVAQGKEPTDEAFFRAFTKDVYLIDLELVRTYAFHHPMPETLRIQETYEIPDLVSSQELLDSKEFIIYMNFDKAGTSKVTSDMTDAQKELNQFYFPDVSNDLVGSLQVMTLQQNLDFIELCVREIPKILAKRYGMQF
ncbi:MAG: zinc dependent phospholipase C family protein [Lachnospiraceae bacterium]|nr:zinc dependent phospholipase C family protein [Lachnospiraceae bacterium]